MYIARCSNNSLKDISVDIHAVSVRKKSIIIIIIIIIIITTTNNNNSNNKLIYMALSPLISNGSFQVTSRSIYSQLMSKKKFEIRTSNLLRF